MLEQLATPIVRRLRYSDKPGSARGAGLGELGEGAIRMLVRFGTRRPAFWKRSMSRVAVELRHGWPWNCAPSPASSSFRKSRSSSSSIE